MQSCDKVFPYWHRMITLALNAVANKARLAMTRVIEKTIPALCLVMAAMTSCAEILCK